MKAKLAILTLVSFLTINDSGPEGWEIFQKVTFTPRYIEEVDGYFDFPNFNPELLALENTDVTLAGYFIPFDIDTVFVLSAMPFSSCFFCGGGGPETVAEIRMEKVPDHVSLDDIIKVTGKLKLNSTDINYMNFILQDAKIIK